MVTLHWKQG